VNTEASAIRSQIAAKEYEIQRLERLKRKDTSIEFDSSLKKLQSELVTLKNRYFTLTDEHYEQSRRGLNRFINSENKKDIKSMDKVEYSSDHKIPSSIESNSNQKVPVASLIKNNNEIKSGDKKEIKAKEANEVILGRPLHWQPWHPEQVSAESSFFFHETFASVDARVNIVMVLMFSLSMIAAMLLANILSQF
jgi:adenine specific DNA methylase Mod